MPVSIHEKIRRQLANRKILSKDLAAFLGIAPQTMTDICKGRSAVTLRHLKGLVDFFQVRADWWLDERRDEPGPLDRLDLWTEDDLRQLEHTLFGLPPSRDRAVARVRLLARTAVPAPEPLVEREVGAG